jgi:ABC-type cobalamin/Fe3+-siderophores transport system ATPase subunit
MRKVLAPAIKLIMALIQGIVFQKADSAKDLRPKTYLICDEFQNFFSQISDEILSESGKNNLFITMAHQYLTQLDTTSRDGVLSGANIFVVGKNSDKELNAMAKQIEVDVSLLKNLKRGEFYIKVASNNAIKIVTTDKYIDDKYSMSEIEWKRIKKQQRKRYYKKIDETLEIMEIKNLSNMKPELLSGGQKQRVALARTLMTNPKILLLDEPLSALDTTMRLKLQDELSLIHQKFNITSILVSHDISEVFKLSNRVFKINLGEIEEDGTPNELFSNQNISGKFKIVGEILSIKKSDILYIIEILSNNEVVKATAVEDEIKDLKIGDKILLSSKAFNPIVNKI